MVNIIVPLFDPGSRKPRLRAGTVFGQSVPTLDGGCRPIGALIRNHWLSPAPARYTALPVGLRKEGK